jgi:hypothetical protein
MRPIPYFRLRGYAMKPRALLTDDALRRETHAYRGTGGTSEESREQGFVPAFRDVASGRVYLSRFANGQPAPLHVVAGLPDEVVVRRDATGRVVAVKGTVVAGFVRQGRFYTREQAAESVEGDRVVAVAANGDMARRIGARGR